MSPPHPSLLRDQLSRRTAVLGLHLWVLVGIAINVTFLLLLALISLRWWPRKGVTVMHALAGWRLHRRCPHPPSRRVQRDPGGCPWRGDRAH
ncbi:unnamed protein product [Urochloa humidicola]